MRTPRRTAVPTMLSTLVIRMISVFAMAVCATVPEASSDTLIYHIVDVPFAGASETELFGINNGGQIVGSYEDANGVRRGFVLKDGIFETIDVPGATDTRAFGINETGQVTGRYQNTVTEPGVQHGFMRQRDGTFTDVDFPGQTFNFAWGINDVGQISGYYFEFPSAEKIFITSFRRDPDGTFTPVLFSTEGAGNVLRGINDAGVQTG